MSIAVKKTKILIVDIEMAMLNVLKNFSDQHRYSSKCYFDPAEACTALAHRKDQGESDYRCVLLGWPDGSSRIMRDLLESLESTAHQDLPLVIVCHEVTVEIQKLVESRGNTYTVQWKQHQTAADLIAGFPVPPENSNSLASPVTKSNANERSLDRAQPQCINALLLDNSPTVSTALRKLMESNGYQVTIAGSTDEARRALRTAEYNLVLTDFFLRGEGAEDFCRFVQTSADFPGRKPVCVVVSSKHSDAIVKRSLAVGAIACFNKDESPELLFARIDALVAALPKIQGSSIVSEAAIGEMLELADDAALVIDNQGLIAGLNRKARQLLDDINRRDLTGLSFAHTVCDASIEIEVKNNANFRTSSGSEIVVTYMAQHISNGSSTGVLLTFNPQSATMVNDEKGGSRVVFSEKIKRVTNPAATQAQPTLAAAIATVKDSQPPQGRVEYAVSPGKVDSAKFAGMLNRVGRAPEKDLSYSLLLLDIELIAATDDRLSVGDSEPMLGIVSKSLASFYTREHTLTYLGNGQFMYLFAVPEQQQALVLTRRLLQVVPHMVKYLSNMVLVSHASLLHLPVDQTREASKIIKICRRSAARARLDKRDNCALVLPVKKYLRAHSAQSGSSRQEKLTAE